jgi:hypothetical protein
MRWHTSGQVAAVLAVAAALAAIHLLHLQAARLQQRVAIIQQVQPTQMGESLVSSTQVKAQEVLATGR